MKHINVIGAGLAGCEACYQLSKRNIPVHLFEMKPKKYSPAHSYDGFAELVCSNSLRSDRLENAVGLLKEELRLLDSLVMRAADATRVPAGGALAVNRKEFSDYITKAIKSDPNVTIIEEELTKIPEDEITIVATGPLTSDAMADYIARLTGSEHLHFFDAAAPIVTRQSIDFSRAYTASRYDRGSDYVNCPMEIDEYTAFYRELINAQCVELKGFEGNNVFEGCMPVEVMAKRGEKTLLFGPLKPVGLIDPHTGKEPYAVVQLRKEDKEGTMYNLVGFQTHLKFGEQKRVFSMIPGLKEAEFIRYGVMHRNTYINSPKLLNDHYQLLKNPNIYFAGQITGVEGYVESTASGYYSAISAASQFLGEELPILSDCTAVGALASYVSGSVSADFQPMNINYGIIRESEQRIRKKAERYAYLAERSLDEIRRFTYGKYDGNDDCRS